MLNRRIIVLGSCAVGAAGLSASRSAAATASTSAKPVDQLGYDVEAVEGWRVHVARSLRQRDSELRDETVKLIRYHLFNIRRRLPPRAVEVLRQTAIVVTDARRRRACVAYRPGGGVGGKVVPGPTVEIRDARAFLDSRDHPCILLSALAEGYYHQRLAGTTHEAKIRSAHAEAVQSGKYDRVLHVGGVRRRHRALASPRDYFVAASVTYFGTNDAYPFVRAQLREADPGGCELVARIWTAVGFQVGRPV